MGGELKPVEHQYRLRVKRGSGEFTEWRNGYPGLSPAYEAEFDIEERDLYASPPPPSGSAWGEPDAPPLVFSYRNHRGEIGMRAARPLGLRFGSTDWHPEPQWLLRAFDLDKQAEREFAVKDIGALTPSPSYAEGVEAAAKVAERLATEAVGAEKKRGFGPETATATLHRFQCENIAEAIRTLLAPAAPTQDGNP